jgi:hypothetical protein
MVIYVFMWKGYQAIPTLLDPDATWHWMSHSILFSHEQIRDEREDQRWDTTLKYGYLMFLGSKVRRAHRADNLTTICEPIV